MDALRCSCSYNKMPVHSFRVIHIMSMNRLIKDIHVMSSQLHCTKIIKYIHKIKSIYGRIEM